MAAASDRLNCVETNSPQPTIGTLQSLLVFWATWLTVFGAFYLFIQLFK